MKNLFCNINAKGVTNFIKSGFNDLGTKEMGGIFSVSRENYMSNLKGHLIGKLRAIVGIELLQHPF